jgi:phage tail-like protein
MAQNYFKHNKVEVFEIITPRFYLDDEVISSGISIKLEDQLVNTHLLLAKNISSIINVSATTNYSSINTLSGIYPFFIPQNKLTSITPFGFEDEILVPLGQNFGNFATSAAFKQYLSGTFLPNSRLNTPVSGLQPTASGTHEYLIDRLGWFYLLNFSATNYSPSSYVLDKLTELYYGKSLTLVDGIKGLETYLWYNYGACSVLQNLGLVPQTFLSGTTAYTSGTQQLNKLLTLTEVVYSDDYLNSDSTYIKDAFEDYVSSESILENYESKGPLFKFLKALSYLQHDIDNEIAKLETLYDIDKCPEEYLPYLAQLLGWHLFGYDTNRWRLQLKNAVRIYKAKGTKRSLQLALDSIFSESFMNLSGSILELHESYIPNLIYYSLATESDLFDSFDTWTPQLARSLGVNDYSTKSMDQNIRYAVDYIILDLVRRFPENFKLGNVTWNIEDPSFRFKYRDRIFQIPPFEEVNYYKDIEITSELLELLVDRVSCFGVSESFVDDLRDFISSYTLESEDYAHVDNRWLFFYLGLQTPPNYDSLLSQYENSKIDYLGLWSADSSHFNLDLFASSFTFDNRSLITSSTLALQEAVRAVNSFTPAHSIPDINLILNENDYADYDENECVQLNYNFIEYYPGSGTVPGFQSSGLNMSSLGRAFGRLSVDSFSDAVMSTSTAIANLPRNTIRRRSLKYVLPRESLYTRTGWNSPIVLQPSTTEYSLSNSGYLPLGYIPSAQAFVEIPQISSIPAIYTKCENLNSSSVYSGVSVSNTYPSRGLSAISSSGCTRYVLRDDTHRIFDLIYEISYEREKQMWADYLNTSAGWALYGSATLFLDVSTSLANSSFAISSFSQYEDFEFGRGIHKIYNSWVKNFGRHIINYNSLILNGGPNIFSHVYGPILVNSKFNTTGSAIEYKPDIVASSFEGGSSINYGNGSGVLSLNDSGYQTYVVSTGLCFGPEFRNTEIIKYVELLHTSGASQDNEFKYYLINNRNKSAGYSLFPIENALLKQKAVNGFPRIIYHLSSTSTILSPEHEFKLDVKYFAGQETGDSMGGGGIGVWIHTEPQNNLVWSWSRKGKWELMTITSSLSLGSINDYVHTHYQPLVEVPLEYVGGYAGQCYNKAAELASRITMENLTEELFSTLTINFNTLNHIIKIPQAYFKDFNQVHKTSQKYVIEIFKIAQNSSNDYVLFDEVNLIDKTLNAYAEEYTPEKLLHALHYMKEIANDKASRQVSVTSGTYGTSGGSRISYREHPVWGGGTYNPTYPTSPSSIYIQN